MYRHGRKNQNDEYGMQKHQFGQNVRTDQLDVGEDDQGKEYGKEYQQRNHAPESSLRYRHPFLVPPDFLGGFPRNSGQIILQHFPVLFRKTDRQIVFE